MVAVDKRKREIKKNHKSRFYAHGHLEAEVIWVNTVVDDDYLKFMNFFY